MAAVGATEGATATQAAITAGDFSGQDVAAPSSDVAESPEGGAEPLTRSPDRTYVPSILRASGAHLEPVGQNEPKGDRKIPNFLRRYSIGAEDDQPIASDREPSEGPQANQSTSGFVPRILREEGWAVTPPPVTVSQAPPTPASVTPAATVAQPAGQ